MAEFVTPSSIGANEPFTFAAIGSVSGTVVNVQTVQGEVVATHRPDRHGRIFLAAGLAAGSYILSSTNGLNSSLGNIEVRPKTTVNWSNTMLQPYKLELLNSGNRARNLFENVRIDVSGGRPNASLMAATCVPESGGGKLGIPVLAATSTELVLGKLADQGVQPGTVCFEIRDEATGQTARTEPTIAYSASGKLTQATVPSGLETRLVVTVQPSSLSGNVDARVTSGPVTLANGAREMSIPLSNGIAEFRILTKPGSSGPFNLGWSLDAPWLFNGKPEENKKPKPGDTEALDDDGWVKFVDENTGRTGKKRLISDKGGARREEIKWDDSPTTYVTKKTTTTEEGTTVVTDSTTPNGGGTDIDIIVVETIGYDSAGKQISGTRKTWKRNALGEETLDSSETWTEKSGWK
jgi:hypothetical protein